MFGGFTFHNLYELAWFLFRPYSEAACADNARFVAHFG